MNLYRLLFLSISLLTVFSASAQIAGVEPEFTEEGYMAEMPALESEIDSTILVPSDLDNVLDQLMHSWVMQYADNSDCTSSEEQITFPDSVYIKRLQQLPYLMEMPYNNQVRSFIDLYTLRRKQQVGMLLGMSDYYFPIFEERLEAYQLPLELRFLPIIESALNATAISRAGAGGLWQFMVATGRMYGLEINSLVDERSDAYKSTDAACRFLRDLYRIYGDWHLVIAAYNCGPGNVNKAIRRAGGARDYWAIYPYLPAETRGYVPIFIGANYAMNYAAEHGICKTRVNIPMVVDTIHTTKRVHLEQVAAVLQLPIEELKRLNPQYRQSILPGNGKSYALTLPATSIGLFIDKEQEILAYKADSLIHHRRAQIDISHKTSVGGSYSSGRVTHYKIKQGDTLGKIAQRHKVSIKQLQQWNNLRGTDIRAGRTLKIYK